MASSLGKFDFEGYRISVLLRRREHLCNQRNLQFEIAPEFLEILGRSQLVSSKFYSHDGGQISVHSFMFVAHKGRTANALTRDLTQKGAKAK